MRRNYQYLSFEDFIQLDEEERLYVYSLGYRLQEPMYAILPRQLPDRLGYLLNIPDYIKKGSTIPIVMSMVGLSEEPIDFFLTVDGDTVYSYEADYGETSHSTLCTINDSPGVHMMEAWVVDSSGRKAILDFKRYTVVDNDDRFTKYAGIGLLAVIGGFLGLLALA